MVRHHMHVAGILRLDHAMGLERLFWVPDGHEARHGVYVRYPRAALFAILGIESARAGCVVVGEDLGTVPDSIRDEMDERGLLGMYVAQFNQPAWDDEPLAPPSPHQLASIDTHDTPTFAGWLHGLDIDRRHVLGQLSDELADAARAERRGQVDNLIATLVHHGALAPGTKVDAEIQILEALLRHLGDSDAPAMLVAVDDLVGERNPQNVPGTLIDRPNWVQRIRFGPRQLVDDPTVGAMLDALQGCRLGAHVRSTGRV
jgi:4-alpha-glucanotransferase